MKPVFCILKWSKQLKRQLWLISINKVQILGEFHKCEFYCCMMVQMLIYLDKDTILKGNSKYQSHF